MGIYNTLQNDTNLNGLGDLGMARPTIQHQRINARICAVMNQILNPEFEAIMEAEIKGTNSMAPDIAVWSLNLSGDVVDKFLIIETTTNNKKSSIEKKILKMFAENPQLKEGFMYIYDVGEWRRYQPNQSNYYINTSCSDYLTNLLNTTIDFTQPLKNAVFHVITSKRKK